jgi:hypothetical protein
MPMGRLILIALIFALKIAFILSIAKLAYLKNPSNERLQIIERTKISFFFFSLSSYLCIPRPNSQFIMIENIINNT